MLIIFHPIMNYEDRVNSVTNRCIEIIHELVSHHHQFATFEKLVEILLNRYSVSNIQSLGFSSFIEVPLLKYLYDINRTIHSFISTYHSTSSIFSSIQSVADLDKELYSFLESFHFPTISSFQIQPRSIVSIDPNVINIDDDINDPIINDPDMITSDIQYDNVSKFGLGAIQCHPLIIHHFQLSNFNTTYSVSSTDVLSLWAQYLSSSNQLISSSSSSSSFQFKVSSFISSVLDTYQVANLSDLGIRIAGDFGPEYQAFSHVINAHHKRWVEFQKRELSQLQKTTYDTTCISTATSSKRQKQGISEVSKPLVIDDTIQNTTSIINSNQITSDQTESSSNVDECAPYEGRMFTQSQDTAIRIEIPSDDSNTDTVNLITVSTTISTSVLNTKSNSSNGLIEDENSHNLITIDSILLQPLAQSMAQYEVLINKSDTHSTSNNHTIDKLKLIGRWGEALVYHHLVTAAAATTVTKCDGCPKSSTNNKNIVTVEWMNQVAETKACYDLIVTRMDTITGRAYRHYIEVKSTRYNDNNVFEISLREYEFAMGLPRVQYSIYRVFNAGDINKVRIVIIPDLYSFISQQKVKLCVAL